jgi:hypothetical protein
LNHSRSSSESRLTAFMNTTPTSSHIDFLRRELEQYLLKHGSAEVIGQLSTLGIELPSSTKENIDHMATRARSTLSDRSRTSSESRLSALLKTGIHRSELKAKLSEAPRGRQL